MKEVRCEPGHVGLVESVQDLVPLRRIQRIQGRHRLRPLGQALVEQLFEISGQANHGRRIEDLGGVFDLPRDALIGFPQGHEHVQLRAARMDLGTGHLDAGKAQRHRRFKSEARLKNRIAACVAHGLGRLQDTGQGNFLVAMMA